MNVRRFFCSLAVALGAVSCGSKPDAAAGGARPSGHTVSIQSMRFVPGTLTVRAGDTIVWRNEDLVPHTVTSRTQRFDSSVIDAGKTWQFTASASGSFDYVCTLHPTMAGKLRVE